MIFSYFISYLKANKFKVGLLIASIALYFSATTLILAISQALPKITQIPLQTIGANIVVQHRGVIPDRIEGIVFPHANGPIYYDDYRQVSKLKFVRAVDAALYFWDFSKKYKSVVGFNRSGSILSPLLSKSVARGKWPLSANQALVSYDYFHENDLKLEQKISIHGENFQVAAVLKPNIEAQIMPADIYIDLAVAQREFGFSPEIRRNYKLKAKRYLNVILLRSDPTYQGDKDKLIKAVNPKFLVYSERTFSKQIKARLQLLSAAGKAILVLLGMIITTAFGGLVFYMVKSRESEVAILRALGWQSKLVRGQFIKELALIIFAGLFLGNLLDVTAISFIKQQKITMEIPWEISAKPHFLEKANAINRTVKASIPVSIDLSLNLLLSTLFILIFIAVAWVVLGKIKRVKTLEVMLH
jgi:hypothetical protein